MVPSLNIIIKKEHIGSELQTDWNSINFIELLKGMSIYSAAIQSKQYIQ